MFDRVQRVRGALRFLLQRLPAYGPPLHEDLRVFRDEAIRATVSAGVAAVAGLIFAGFASFAVIVSLWDTPARGWAAWAVAGLWGVLALFGAVRARRALRGPPPFRLLQQMLERDYGHLKDLVSSDPQQ